MPKDNENVPLSICTTDDLPEPSITPFSADQMVRCETCLRANPPTRVTCLYCGGALPQTEQTLELQKPMLRPLEKWEQGYNNILMSAASEVTSEALAAASDILRLQADELRKLLSSTVPVPLARPASLHEAELIERRLHSLGINTRIMPDADLGLDAMPMIKIRSLEFDETVIYAYQSPETESIAIEWSDIVLIVTGRLVFKRVELTEKKGSRADAIIDASEFAADEAVFDFYSGKTPASYRIAAGSFDFSCLGSAKGLLTPENLARLIRLFRERAPGVVYDDSFNGVRRLLELVWPVEQQNQSSGWRRERPGKYSVGMVSGLNNEAQFLRYSRLRYQLNKPTPAKASE